MGKVFSFLMMMFLAGFGLVNSAYAELSTSPREGFYLRADLGTAQYQKTVSPVSYRLYEAYSIDIFHNGNITYYANAQIKKADNDIVALGFGYQLTHNFRVEFMGEFRTGYEYKSRINLYDKIAYNDDVFYTPLNFEADIKTYVGMLNFYYDATNLKTYITSRAFFIPYIMGGIGYARHYVKNALQYDSNNYTNLDPNLVGNADKTTVLEHAKITKDSLVKTFGVGISFYPLSFIGFDVAIRYFDLGEIDMAFPEYSANVIDKAASTDPTSFKMLREFGKHAISNKGTEFRLGAMLAF